VPSATEVGEALSAGSNPLHVLDPRTLAVRYQNAASLALFGPLADQAALDALADPQPGELQALLRNVLHLKTREGHRAFLLETREQGGWLIQEMKDISALELQLDDLCRGLQVDPVSQTLNRRALMYSLVREMSRAQRSGEPLYYLMVGMAGLREAEAQYGEPALDQVIARVADLLRSTLRQTDFIGRCERERLALILPATDAAGAAWVAERSRQLVNAAPLRYDETTLDIRLLSGFAEFRSGDTPEDMAQRAREQIDLPD
jgi:diguanylate cyclase (GGDEF)-like protein